MSIGLEKSFEKFKEIEKDFGKELFAKHDIFEVLVWRERLKDKKLCIIQFLKSGKGYRIYALETENVEEREIFKPRQQELDF
ncbi:MAG: hypothetical protein DCE86_17730 [Flavobacteriaceae bacterium]|nr:MAG: hypothetical protein DCE86_17730 [Flavobacteriaceae bacterium]